MKPLAFEHLNKGQALKRANEAIRAAIENCLDPNTPLKDVRAVKILLNVETVRGQRERVSYTPVITSNLIEPQLRPSIGQIHLIKQVAQIEEEEEISLFEWKPAPLSADETPTLETLNAGNVLAEFNYALEQVVANIANADTPATGRRAATCIIKFTNLEESAKRGPIQAKFTVTTKLASRVIAPTVFRMAAPVVEADYPVAYDESAAGKEAISVEQN